MNKEQALAKIEELKKFVENLDKKQDAITKYPLGRNEKMMVNGKWAAEVCSQDNYNKKSGHPWDRCGLYLYNCDGRWVNEQGIDIPCGHIFFIPNSQP